MDLLSRLKPQKIFKENMQIVQGADPIGGFCEALHLEPGERARDDHDRSRSLDHHPEHRGECEFCLNLLCVSPLPCAENEISCVFPLLTLI